MRTARNGPRPVLGPLSRVRRTGCRLRPSRSPPAPPTNCRAAPTPPRGPPGPPPPPAGRQSPARSARGIRPDARDNGSGKTAAHIRKQPDVGLWHRHLRALGHDARTDRAQSCASAPQANARSQALRSSSTPRRSNRSWTSKPACRSPTQAKFSFKHRHEDGNCPAITAGSLSQEEIGARRCR